MRSNLFDDEHENSFLPFCFPLANLPTGFSSGFTDDEAPPDGKILFKKPAKRSSSDKFQGITASSSKKKKSSSAAEKDEEEEKKDGKPGKKIKNNSLLSFGDEDEEED